MLSLQAKQSNFHCPVSLHVCLKWGGGGGGGVTTVGSIVTTVTAVGLWSTVRVAQNDVVNDESVLRSAANRCGTAFGLE